MILLSYFDNFAISSISPVHFLVLIHLRKVFLYARQKYRERLFLERYDVISRLLLEPETHTEKSPRREALLDECFWYMKQLPIATNPEVRSHFDKKLPMLKQSMLPENEGKFELSETEEKIVECLKRTEAYDKVMREPECRSSFLADFGFGPWWDKEMERYQLGPSMSCLEHYVWEQDFVFVKTRDVEGFED
jgi:hypothetical protein